MARRPEVFARSLESEEAQRLVKITRSAKDRVRLRRSGIVLASTQGRSSSLHSARFQVAFVDQQSGEQRRPLAAVVDFHPDRDRLELEDPIDINLHLRRRALKRLGATGAR